MRSYGTRSRLRDRDRRRLLRARICARAEGVRLHGPHPHLRRGVGFVRVRHNSIPRIRWR